ncbi:unnamed protein product [Amoebophrya sp. A25]|nr:unnamed protein product [Amoebophrya sp. A25]|eukprot:GSA25T00006862001.1
MGRLGKMSVALAACSFEALARLHLTQRQKPIFSEKKDVKCEDFLHGTFTTMPITLEDICNGDRNVDKGSKKKVIQNFTVQQYEDMNKQMKAAKSKLSPKMSFDALRTAYSHAVIAVNKFRDKAAGACCYQTPSKAPRVLW